MTPFLPLAVRVCGLGLLLVHEGDELRADTSNTVCFIKPYEIQYKNLLDLGKVL